MSDLLRTRLAELRRAPDQGSALVEAALVLPLVVVLTLGIIEYGTAWRQATVTDRSSAAAGRTAASLANSPMTDYEVLRAVDSGMAATVQVEIERVIVYRSQTADGAVPAACLAITPSGTGSFGVSGVCNVYSAQQVASDSFGGFRRGSAANPQCIGGSWDAAWCPIGRNRDRPSPDYVGVYVEARYDSLTSLIPGTEGLELSSNAVFLLEPAGMGET